MKTLNVDEVCQVRINSRTFGSTQTWENITSSCHKQKRNVTPLFWVGLTFECYEDAMVFHVLIIIFFRINGLKGHLDESDLRYFYGNFLWKWRFESSFSTVTKHIDNRILKETLQLNILQTWVNILAKSFIKASINMKRKSIKVPRKDQLHRNPKKMVHV